MVSANNRSVMLYVFSLAGTFNLVSWKTSGNTPDSKVHGANMGPTWVLSAPDGPHIVPMNLALWDFIRSLSWNDSYRGVIAHRSRLIIPLQIGLGAAQTLNLLRQGHGVTWGRTTDQVKGKYQSLQWRHNGCDGVSNHLPTIVYSTVYSGVGQRKLQSSVSLAFVRGIHRWPVNSPHKWPVIAENVSIWWRHHVYLYKYSSVHEVNSA